MPSNASSSTRRHSSCLCTDAAPLSVAHTSIAVAPLDARWWKEARRRGAGQRHRRHQLQRSPMQLHMECIIHFVAKLFAKSYNTEPENLSINRINIENLQT